MIGPGDEITTVALIAADNYTATVTGTGLDKTDYEGRAKVTLVIGTVAGDTPTLDVTLEHSDDDSTYSTVYTWGQVTAAGNPASTVVNADSLKKYVRAVATIAGTTPAFGVAVLWQGMKKSI